MKLRISSILLVMAALCFLLPFVNVRCSPELSQQMSQASGADSTATPAKGDIFFYYTGLQLVLGQEPTYPESKATPQADSTKMMQEEETQPQETEEAAEETIGRAPQKGSRDPFVAVQAEQAMDPVKAEKSSQEAPEAATEATEDTVASGQKPAPTSNAKVNIYAMLALLTILIALFMSTIKGIPGLLLTAIFCVIPVALLNLLKMNFGTYLQDYMQLETQYMSYLQVEFTPWYWVSMALIILGFVDAAVGLLRFRPARDEINFTQPEQPSLYQDISIDEDTTEMQDNWEESQDNEEDKPQT